MDVNALKISIDVARKHSPWACSSGALETSVSFWLAATREKVDNGRIVGKPETGRARQPISDIAVYQALKMNDR